MTPIKVTIHGSGIGSCLLSGKPDCDGLTVTLDDGTVKEAFLSWKSFRQLLALKSSQVPKPETKLPAASPITGTAAGTAK